MFLEVRGLSHAFREEAVLRDVSLDVAEHGVLAIMGRSGAGKTTLLKSIAGLLAPQAGSILLQGRDITRLSPAQRGVVYLYQEPLLFPHLSVFENVAFGLRLRRTPQQEVIVAVREMIDKLELNGHESKRPAQLSGGQKQRVSFGRALIIRPALLLLDEPFSSLDPETRAAMQALYRSAAREFGMTTVFVTHSLKEALIMGDSLGILESKTLRRYATRQEFIAAPESGVAQESAFWTSLQAPVEKSRL